MYKKQYLNYKKRYINLRKKNKQKGGKYDHKNCKNYEQLDGCELYNRAHMLAIIFSTPLSLYIKYNVK